MSALPLQAFFLPTPTGERFCLFHPAQGHAAKGQVLYLHPWAEELNCSRRIVAQQARALAQAGYGVLQIDLLGCGDSAGHFEDASWQAWLEDAHQALHWLQQHSQGPLWLWGLRTGALLTTALAAQLKRPSHLLWWQPVLDGRPMLQQFLRLHQAGQWLGTDSGAGPSPAQRLEQGRNVAIAGYGLSPTLAQGLANARLEPQHLPPMRLLWLETSAQPPTAVNPAAAQHMAVWRQAGWRVQAQAVHCRPFWQTATMDDAPALLQATLQGLAVDSP